jgi:hypothetical protein
MLQQVIKTPKEKLARSIDAAKEAYKESVAVARLRYGYETLPPEVVANKMKAGVAAGKQKTVARLYNSLPRERQAEIARALIGKALTVTCRIQEGFALMTNLTFSDTHYTIIFDILNGLSFRHNVEYTTRPDGAQVLSIAKNYFPNVKQVTL